MLVKDLLNDESKWIQGVFFRDAEDKECGKDKACKFCLSGAIKYVYGCDEYGCLTNHEYFAICSFNDDPTTTFEDIRKVLEIANV